MKEMIKSKSKSKPPLFLRAIQIGQSRTQSILGDTVTRVTVNLD